MDAATPSAQPAAIATPLAELHKSSGATLGNWFGCELPDHWSDPLVEQEFAEEAVALIDKNHRCYLSFGGPDRVRYLNATLTNNIKDLAPGQGTISLLLNAQGHILAELETYALADSLLCVSYAMIREKLIAWLDKYIIMDDVTLTDVTDQFGTLALEGPKADKVVRELTNLDLASLGELHRIETSVASIPCSLIKRSPGNVPGAKFLTGHAHLPNLWGVLLDAVKKHDGGPMGYSALSARRLTQDTPWFGYDFGEKQIPHEAGLQDTHISYTKGCYTGQEIVERVRSRGQVNRQRVTLIFDSTTIPSAGDTLAADGKEAGFITRAATSFLSPNAIAMGYVRREFSTPGTKLSWQSVHNPALSGNAVVSRFPDDLLPSADSV